ncbi:MAG: PqqD family protein [Candidatus Kapaibacteriota bacterium]
MFTKRKIPKKTNFLELTPISKIQFEKLDEDKVLLLIPRFKSKFAQKYLIPKFQNKYIKANLDEFGSSTYLLIDGNRNVYEISNLLREKYGEKVEPVYERVTKFFGYLYQYGLITFKEIEY